MEAKKTHIDKLRNPDYLGSWDLLDENGKNIDLVVTIKEIRNEAVFNQKNQSEEQVISVNFLECKPIILNSTNRKALKTVTGTDFIEDMVGKKIQLTTKKIRAFGEMHDAIRISSIKPNPQESARDKVSLHIKNSTTTAILERCYTAIPRGNDELLQDYLSKWIDLSENIEQLERITGGIKDDFFDIIIKFDDKKKQLKSK